MSVKLRRILSALWPWLVGLAIVVLVATRVPFGTLREAMDHGPHLALAAANLILFTLILFTDSWASWVGLGAVGVPLPFRQVVWMRGASYPLVVLNYAAGQGGFGWFLHRAGVPPLRTAGAVLFLIGTNLVALLVATTVAWWTFGGHGIGWVLFAGDVAIAAYLAVIAWAPAWLARRPLLAPLFEAGLSGHAKAGLARLPHVIVVVVGQWAALRVWGIAVPLEAGVAYMPAVAIVSVLPISPAGLGSTSAALIFFFAAWAPEAQVLAFSLVHYLYGVLAILLLGLACRFLGGRDRVAPIHARG